MVQIYEKELESQSESAPKRAILSYFGAVIDATRQIRTKSHINNAIKILFQAERLLFHTESFTILFFISKSLG